MLKALQSLAAVLSAYPEPRDLHGLPWPTTRKLLADLMPHYPTKPQDEGPRLLLLILCESHLPPTDDATPSELAEWLEAAMLAKKPLFTYVRGQLKGRARSWERAKKRASVSGSTTSDPALSLAAVEAFESLRSSQQDTLNDYFTHRDVRTLAALWNVKETAAYARIERAKKALSQALLKFL